MRIRDWSSDVCSSDLRAVGRGGDRFHAVQADAGELRAEPAHGDRAAFAGVALDRNARNALKRFGEILVGEFGDVLGDDHIDRRDRVALLIERIVERSEEHTSELQSLMRNSYAVFCLKQKI